MPRESRKCIKHDENLSQYPDITLEVFKNYSREACLLECQARKIQELCGCLPYYYPDFSRLWKKNTDCNLEGLRCLANISGKVDLIFKPLRYLLYDYLMSQNGKVFKRIVTKLLEQFILSGFRNFLQ